jgi:hypothetical protein
VRGGGVPLIVPTYLRPLLVVLAQKAFNLWSRPISYFFFRSNKTDCIKGSDLRKKENIITLDEIIESAKTDDRALTLLKKCKQCWTRVPLTHEEKAAAGLVTSEALSFCMERITLHTADIRHNTVEWTTFVEAKYNQQLYDAEEGDLGKCKKDFPVSPHFTPGLFSMQCICKFPCIYRLLLMDSYESPRHVMDSVFMSYEKPPEVIIYDAVRFMWYDSILIPSLS